MTNFGRALFRVNLGENLTVEFVDSVGSTQEVLCEGVRNMTIDPPFMLVAKEQTNGIGSRGNSWQGLKGNLFLSFCMDEDSLPKDLPSASASIYFSMIMKEILSLKGSKIWVKWPNDFYMDDKKIGGTITTKINKIYICGMGINLQNAPENAGVLDINIAANDVVWDFVQMLEKKILWKQTFSKFRIDFQKSKKFITHIGTQAVSLEGAHLCDDGAILLNEKKVYSLR